MTLMHVYEFLVEWLDKLLHARDHHVLVVPRHSCLISQPNSWSRRHGEAGTFCRCDLTLRSDRG